MDGLTIFWTQTAILQRNHVFDYWNNRNKSKTYSKKLNLAIRERIELLKFHPEMGKSTDFVETRVVTMGHYSILYKIDGSRIQLIFKSGIHQKFSIIDQKIVWYGIINLLSYGSAEDNMMRIESTNMRMS